MTAHFGRSWAGHQIEDNCPCPKAPCGLAAPASIFDSECPEHNGNKTMRQIHHEDDCPARKDTDS